MLPDEGDITDLAAEYLGLRWPKKAAGQKLVQCGVMHFSRLLRIDHYDRQVWAELSKELAASTAR